ncbi:hypothetical protein [Bradyrhizobium sp. OAE829]|uniref:hypothetical protein n=1 Tax=Bradyrhizobium sp. OAE829 TaxID=2663807 RepID=UPI001789F409
MTGLVVAILVAVLFKLTAFTPAFLVDGDTWLHVAAGEWILDHRTIPRTDPFSHSMLGAPWTAHEWLSEIVLALSFRAGGWSGVSLIAALAASAAALILGLRLTRDLAGAALVIVLELGIWLWFPSLTARPHILALPIAALWTAGLLAARDRDAPPPLAFALLMILWSNLHGGFAFGIALIAPFAAEALLTARPGARIAAVRGWAIFGCAAVAASLVNPYGIEAVIFPFRVLGIENLSRVSEWAAQDFSRFSQMQVALIALIGFALVFPMKTPPIRAALVALLVLMALMHIRHMQLFGLIAPMLLARPIAGAIGARPPEDARRITRTALAACLVLTLPMAVIRASMPIVRTNGQGAPIAALAAVPAQLRDQPVLNEYPFGGYLVFARVRPFIDGRADMYGGSMLGRYLNIDDGDEAALKETLARYKISWTIFSPDARTVGILDREHGWRRLFADNVAVVHVRLDALP